MKKIVLVLLCVLCLCSCGNNKQEKEKETIRVISSFGRHEKVLEYASELLNEDYVLEVIYTDDLESSAKLINDEIYDVNYCLDFMNYELLNDKYELFNLGAIDYEPRGFYSQGYSSLIGVKNDSKVIVPYSRKGRTAALLLLEEMNCITLKEDVDRYDLTLEDIDSYIKDYEISEAKDDELSEMYDIYPTSLVFFDVDLAIQKGLNPGQDFIMRQYSYEGDPFVNILCCKKGEEESSKIKAFVEVMNSDEIKEFIYDTYADGSLRVAEHE